MKIREIIKALGLAILVLLLGTIAPSPAQQQKQYIFLFAEVVKEQQGKCPGYDYAIQIFHR